MSAVEPGVDPGAGDHDHLLALASPAPTGPAAPTTWWLLRVVLPGLVTVAVVADAVLGDEVSGPCTVVDPCTWPTWSAAVDGPDLAAVVLAWLLPAVGLPLVAVTGAAYLASTYEAGDPLAWSLPLALQVAVALVGTGVVLRARRRPGATSSAPLPERGREVLAVRGPVLRDVLAVAGVVGALVLAGWWGLQQERLEQRVSTATATTVEVVAVDGDAWTVDVALPDGRTAVLDDTYEPLDLTVGQQLPALVGTTGTQPWVSLASEPEEVTGWLVLAVAALVLGLVLGGARVGVRRRRRRLLRHGGPLWRTTSVPGQDGDAVLLPELGLRLPVASSTPVDELLEDVGATGHGAWADTTLRQPLDDDADALLVADEEDFAAAWRGEASEEEVPGAGDAEPTVLVGDPRLGGVALAVTRDLVLVPCGALAPLSPGDRAWVRLLARAPGGAGSDGGAGDAELDRTGLPGRPVPPLPGSDPLLTSSGRVEQLDLSPAPWRRLLALSVLLVPVVGWLALHPRWALEDGDVVGVTDVLWPFALALPALGGLTAARRGVRVAPGGVRVRDGGLTRHLPWARVVGTRVVGRDVVLALGLDEDDDVDAVGGRPPAGLDAERAAGLAERWRRAADPGPEPSRDAATEPVGDPGPDGSTDRSTTGARLRPDPVVLTAVGVLVVLLVVALAHHLLA